MHNFEVLFDDAEPAALDHPAYAPYGRLGFPAPPADRPWIYSNFVQSLDGIASFRGRHPLGSDISQSPEDRWLMDLLRAHADGVILGINTLVEETLVSSPRGPVYRIEEPELQELRGELGRRPETNVFVTGSGDLDLSSYRVFDGDLVKAILVTTTNGRDKLTSQRLPNGTEIVVAGEAGRVDLPRAIEILRARFAIKYLLCEGGPTFYGYMSRAGLIDEKFSTVSPIEAGLLVPPEQEPSEAEKSNPPKSRPTTFTAPGFTKESAPWWRWLSCRRVGSHQFNRFRRIR